MTFTNKEHRAALAEGWLLGERTIERDDDQSTFVDDDAALEHVQRRAAQGSTLHIRALNQYDPPLPQKETATEVAVPHQPTKSVASDAESTADPVHPTPAAARVSSGPLQRRRYVIRNIKPWPQIRYVFTVTFDNMGPSIDYCDISPLAAVFDAKQQCRDVIAAAREGFFDPREFVIVEIV